MQTARDLRAATDQLMERLVNDLYGLTEADMNIVERVRAF